MYGQWQTRVLTKLWPCSTDPTILPKNGAHVRPHSRNAENFDVFTGKSPWWRLHFRKVPGLEFIPAN